MANFQHNNTGHFHNALFTGIHSVLQNFSSIFSMLDKEREEMIDSRWKMKDRQSLNQKKKTLNDNKIKCGAESLARDS